MAETTLKKRKLQAIQTRKKIYETAIALFSSRGYENVTIQDISKAVGLSKGAFYVHFKSKDQVIIEYFMKVDQYYYNISERISNLKNSEKKLISFSNLTLKYMNELGISSMRVVYKNQISPNEKSGFMISPSRYIYKFLGELIRNGQQKGEFRSDISAKQIVSGIVSCYRGIIYNWILYDGKKRIEELGKP